MLHEKQMIDFVQECFKERDRKAEIKKNKHANIPLELKEYLMRKAKAFIEKENKVIKKAA